MSFLLSMLVFVVANIPIYIYIYTLYKLYIYTVPIDKNFLNLKFAVPNQIQTGTSERIPFFQFTFVAHHIHESLDYYIPYEQVQKSQSFLADFLLQRNAAWATLKKNVI